MARVVTRALSAKGISDRLLGVTCDNTGNNSTIVGFLEEILDDKNITWSSEENYIPYLAYVINLVVQEIISHLKLAATPEIEGGESLQRRHVSDIRVTISVPNSLKKAGHGYHSLLSQSNTCTALSYLFIDRQIKLTL
jgi:hypothetical protein